MQQRKKGYGKMSDLPVSDLPVRRRYVRRNLSKREVRARRNIFVVIAFSLIGLLLTLVLMLCFPDLGALVAQYNKF